MSMNKGINLKVTSDSLKAFCQEIAIGSANTNRKHAAFMALEAFISRHAGVDAQTQAYRTMQEIVQEFSTKTRAQLLTENANTLISALNQQEIQAISRIFSSVSRNGFKQIFTQAMEGATTTQFHAIKQWANDWCISAKEQAEQASGYPDAPDFRKIDIDLIEYTALSEINTLLMALKYGTDSNY